MSASTVPMSQYTPNQSYLASPNNEGTASHPSRGVSGLESTHSYEQSRRQVSSVVISEEFLGPIPEPIIKYIEVPVIEDVVRHVPRRVVVEVEKPNTTYEIQYVDRVVEVPQIHYVDRMVEKVEVQEIIRTIPVRQVQNVPREVITTVPRIEYVQVEKIVEIDQIVEVPRPYVVEQRSDVRRFVDTETPVVVAQTIRPIITETDQVVDVEVFEYEPQVITVDVHVAKPVPSHLTSLGLTQETHELVSVPAAQYNSILRSLNPHLTSEPESLPFLRDENTGLVNFLGNGEHPVRLTAPHENARFGPVETSSQMTSGLNGGSLPSGLKQNKTSNQQRKQSNQPLQSNYQQNQQQHSNYQLQQSNYPQQQGFNTGSNNLSNVPRGMMDSATQPMMQSDGSLPPTYPVLSRDSKSAGKRSTGSGKHSNAPNRSGMPATAAAQHKKKGCQC